MDRRRLARLAVASPLLSLLCLSASPASAGAYKCRDPDGQISYQEAPCPADSQGVDVAPDIAAPSGAPSARAARAYTVERQLKALESERRKARKERQEREKGSSGGHERRTEKVDYDAARCAKHRAEAARWRREVRNGYQDRDQQEQEAQTLKYHEAQTVRYCRPQP